MTITICCSFWDNIFHPRKVVIMTGLVTVLTFDCDLKIYFIVFVCNSCGEKQPNETGSHHPLHTCFHYG